MTKMNKWNINHDIGYKINAQVDGKLSCHTDISTKFSLNELFINHLYDALATSLDDRIDNQLIHMAYGKNKNG